MRTTRNRFSLLHLSEGESYFSDYSSYYYPPGHRSTAFQNHKKVKGRLILCSKSIMFDPENSVLPIIRIDYKHFISIKRNTEHLFEEKESFQVTSKLIFEFMASNIITPYKIRKFRGTHGFSLIYSALTPFIKTLKQLNHIYNLPRDEGIPSLEMIISENHSRTPFDKSWIEDISELSLIEAPVSLLTPMVKNAGRLLLTNKVLYFQPFSRVTGEFVHKFKLDEIERVYKRQHLYENIGIELFLIDCSAFFVFKNQTHRDQVWNLLTTETPLKSLEMPDTNNMTLKWRNRLISNFEYIQYLNHCSHRTTNDITQYPVFPWIISDFKSKELNLNSPKTFRDLSKPIGALNPERLIFYQQRYQDMPEPKFLYGTHYSTPSFVLYYLARIMPQECLRLHNGRFDSPNRMFHSVSETWKSVTTNHADVKELLPEFYTGDGSFLLNEKLIDFGVRENGERIHDVILPPWASNPKDFIQKNRAALESEYVSAHLNNWIDLIWGFKSRGVEALNSNNLFFHFTYDTDVALLDDEEKRSIQIQIQEFGQCPKQLFNSPHVKRLSLEEAQEQNRALQNVTMGFRRKQKEARRKQELREADESLIQGGNLSDIQESFRMSPHRATITSASLSNEGKIIAVVSSDSTLKVIDILQQRQTRSISLGDLALSGVGLTQNEKNVIATSWDNCIYVYSIEYGRVTDKIEAHDDAVSAMRIRNGFILTGSWDASVKLWRIKGSKINKEPQYEFIENESEVKCVDFNDEYVVAGNEEGQIVTWDIRNGTWVSTQDVHDGPITGIKFVRKGEWLISSGEDGIINICENRGSQLLSINVGLPVTSFSTDGLILIAGDQEGNISLWNLTDGTSLKKFNKIHSNSIGHIQISKDKRTVVSCSDEFIIWKC